MQVGADQTSSWGTYLIIVGIGLAVAYFVARYLQRRKASTAAVRTTSDLAQKEQAKSKLLELLKSQKNITINQACTVLGTTPADFKKMVYGLVGEGKFAAEFQGDELIVTSGTEEFTKFIDSSFERWKSSQSKKV